MWKILRCWTITINKILFILQNRPSSLEQSKPQSVDCNNKTGLNGTHIFPWMKYSCKVNWTVSLHWRIFLKIKVIFFLFCQHTKLAEWLSYSWKAFTIHLRHNSPFRTRAVPYSPSHPSCMNHKLHREFHTFSHPTHTNIFYYLTTDNDKDNITP